MTDASDRSRQSLTIGLTGPIGCGKSTVASWLAARPGALAIDADLVARAVLEPGSPQLEAVYARFGEDLRGPDGELDRAALGRIVFADPAALAGLERIVHPAVRGVVLERMAAARDAGATLVVIEAIKLVEGGLADRCDEVWLVDCDHEVQLERLLGRGTGLDDARRRIAAQAGLLERVRARADRQIDTSGGPAETGRAVERAIEAALASHSPNG